MKGRRAAALSSPPVLPGFEIEPASAGPISESRHLADVAVPLPLPAPLTYELPAGAERLPLLGCRVRVQVGSRKVTGVVVSLHDTPPAGITLRPVDRILDRRPILPPDLLDLARFAAYYYLAPLGEVLRGMFPSDLPPWENPVLKLTTKGAFTPVTEEAEVAIVEILRSRGDLHVLDLELLFPGPADLFEPNLSRLQAAGFVSSDEGRSRSPRFIAAVELASGERESLLSQVGRSAAGRAVVKLLAEWGRPATVTELVEAAECGVSVVQRLVAKGILRRFTQVEKMPLDRHFYKSKPNAEPIELRADQGQAYEEIRSAVSERRFAPFLLQGMTGSGKTEVYLRAAEHGLAEGRGAILLVPEIGLVPALAGELERRFGADLAVLHSNLSGGERFQEWERIRRGEARLVVGPRSALFAPLADVGLIVVDEEQDSSYKQDGTPRYNARDLALVRGRGAAAAVVLVSATPSLESRLNAETEKLRRLGLTSRVGVGQLPEPILVDLRQEEGGRLPGEVKFSERLRIEIRDALERQEQVILLRNRRGYSPALLCRACGEDFRCSECGLPRTYHRREERLVCHYCGDLMPVPRSCPTCGEEALEPMGSGTERVEETFSELFPDVPVDVLDRDSLRRPGGIATILERFGRGEVRVLIGTQMVSKGHHFPGVSLTGVLAADAYLSFPDFRAVERTYNLLTQFAGRAGRGERPGKVVIQTYQPDHYAIRAALANDDSGFAEEEMRFRRVFHYPPYTRMVQLLLQDKSRERASGAATDLFRSLVNHPLARGVRIVGPAPAPLERLRGLWRFQILLRARDGRGLHRLVKESLPRGGTVDLTVDVDPQQLL